MEHVLFVYTVIAATGSVRFIALMAGVPHALVDPAVDTAASTVPFAELRRDGRRVSLSVNRGHVGRASFDCGFT